MGHTSIFYKSSRSTIKVSRSAIDAWLVKAITESAQVKIEDARIQFPFNWITYVERLAKAYQQKDKFLLTEQNVLRFLANIIMIVHRLNSSSIFHRDLKPENFLIKNE